MADDIIILRDIKEYRDIQSLHREIEKLRDRGSRVKEPAGFLSMPKINEHCQAIIGDSTDTSSTEERQQKITQFLAEQISLYQSYLNKLRAPKTTRINPPKPAIEGYDSQKVNLIKIAKQKQDTYNQAYEKLTKNISTICSLRTFYQKYNELIEKIENATTKLSISLPAEVKANKLNSEDENFIEDVLKSYQKIPAREGKFTYTLFGYYNTKDLQSFINEIDITIQQVTNFNNIYNYNYNRVKDLIDKLDKYSTCLEEFYKNYEERIEHERKKVDVVMREVLKEATKKELETETTNKLEEGIVTLKVRSKKLRIAVVLLGVILFPSLFLVGFFSALLERYFWAFLLFLIIAGVIGIATVVIIIIMSKINDKVKNYRTVIEEKKKSND